MSEKNRYVRARERNGLTPAELAILDKLGQGLCRKTIAAGLGKHTRTVTTQLRSLLKVTGSKNQFQLGVWASRRGYL